MRRTVVVACLLFAACHTPRGNTTTPTSPDENEGTPTVAISAWPTTGSFFGGAEPAAATVEPKEPCVYDVQLKSNHICTHKDANGTCDAFGASCTP
jgi:hypothetical protein